MSVVIDVGVEIEQLACRSGLCREGKRFGGWSRLAAGPVLGTNAVRGVLVASGCMGAGCELRAACVASESACCSRVVGLWAVAGRRRARYAVRFTNLNLLATVVVGTAPRAGSCWRRRRCVCGGDSLAAAHRWCPLASSGQPERLSVDGCRLTGIDKPPPALAMPVHAWHLTPWKR